ncbi:SNAP receptor [Kappamyces sp. JEL0680]|nr:SNAP receptor [Kappamyces sp. JEL0680]
MLHQAVVIRLQSNASPQFLVSTVDHFKHSEVSFWIDLEKPLVAKLSKTLPLPSMATIYARDYDYHFLTRDGLLFMCVADATHSKSAAFLFLKELAQYFCIRPEYNALGKSTRPYALMALEPWITGLRNAHQDSRGKRRQSINDGEIMAVDIQDLLPQEVLARFARPAPKIQLATNWNLRFLITLVLALFALDLGWALDLILQWLAVLKTPVHRIDRTFVIFSHNGLTLMLGLLSPVYLFLASLYHLKFPITRSGLYLVFFHSVLQVLQIIHVLLFERPDYQKPQDFAQLTTLQTWATLFDSFSLPIPILFLKLIHLLVLYHHGYLNPHMDEKRVKKS